MIKQHPHDQRIIAGAERAIAPVMQMLLCISSGLKLGLLAGII